MNDFDTKNALWAVASALLLATAGLLLHPYFQQLSFIQMEEVQVRAIEAGTQSKLSMLFASSLALIPLLFFAMKKMLKLTQPRQYFFAIVAMLVSGVIFWQFKINSLQMRYEELAKMEAISYYFALEDLRLELYLLVGLVVGAGIGSIALYRFSQKSR